jgi:RNA polymerase sigma factor (sigma-70 family)
MYNNAIMPFRNAARSFDRELHLLDPVKLFRLCAADREDSIVWAEFLHRYGAKIKYFIEGTLRQVLGYRSCPNDPDAMGGVQENDLFQNAILRLVENDCAAMNRFSGTSENELFDYLAVICRSAVLDTLRHANALKRTPTIADKDKSAFFPGSLRHADDLERDILVSELVSLTQQITQSQSGDVSVRDQLVFKLHFLEGLSHSQIALCKGVDLSKAGVEKLLKRLLSRVQLLVSPSNPEGRVQ